MINMRTAIDSSVLWSVFKGESDAKRWIDLLISTREASSLIVCEIVVAEIAPLFRNLVDLEAKLESLGVDFDPIRPESAFMAGEIFRDYRRHGGPRTQLIQDFLIGAHAMNQADCLAAQDRGYLRAYFPGLRIVRPE
jgi:predicted nucleic acid-binding protein